ncbi:FAD-binding oxidoreductase [Pseudactinotalea suaedae]|uniref:FAD-binding oxidoreductase n=1 Tax=Pseudactinotalea suaedae TaxID=1524924 RepID=UPI0012E15CD0|nr:FAD-dependent oxidoreductase [Pseudactinotalea suaedae]
MLSTLEQQLDGFTGPIITPDSPDYDAAARTPLASSSPALVLRPRDVADAQRAVRAAAASGLPVAVRGGGHSFAALGTVDDGVVIDLGALSSVEVLDGGRVRVGGGATWGEVVRALAPHGLAISSGDTASVGVGGLTLSGGIGWMVRAHGLTLDRLVAAEVVTAAGEVLTASSTSHPDLFWALRGGGGGVGVVTAFELQAAELTTVTFGTLTFPAAEAAQVVGGWAAHLRTAPRELTSAVRLANPFAGGPDAPVEVTVCAIGEDAASLVAPLRGLGTLQSDTVAVQAYGDILEEGHVLPAGLRLAVRNGLVPPESADAAVAEVVAIAAEPQPTAIVLNSLGGALADVGADETAFAHRRAELMLSTFAGGPAPAFDGILAGVESVWARLTPHVDGAYANFLDGSSPEVQASARPEATRRRLEQVRASYDPAALFARRSAN